MLSSSQVREKARNTFMADMGKPLLLTLIFYAVSMGASMVISFISGIFSAFSAIIPILPSLISLAISILFTLAMLLFSFGYYQSLMKIHRNEQFNYGDIFTLSYNNLKRNVAILWQTIVKLWLPLLLMVIAYVVFAIAMVVAGVFGGITASVSDSPDVTLGIWAIIFILVAIFGLALITASAVFFYIKSLNYQLIYYIAYDKPDMSPKDVVEESERLMKDHKMDFFKLQFSFVGWALLASLTCGIGMLLLIPYMQLANIVFYEDRLADPVSTTVE